MVAVDDSADGGAADEFGVESVLRRDMKHGAAPAQAGLFSAAADFQFARDDGGEIRADIAGQGTAHGVVLGLLNILVDGISIGAANPFAHDNDCVAKAANQGVNIAKETLHVKRF